MAELKTDNGIPVPQWYDQELDDWVFYTNEYMKELLSKIEEIKSAQTDGSQKVQVSAEIEALLQGFATEGKLEQVRALLAGTATEDTLEQARILLASLDGKDYATQATLAAVLVKLGQLETEIQVVKANQVSGDQKVTLSGNNVALVVMADTTLASGGTATHTAVLEGFTHYAVAVRCGAQGLYRIEEVPRADADDLESGVPQRRVLLYSEEQNNVSHKFPVISNRHRIFIRNFSGGDLTIKAYLIGYKGA